ncbi:dihydropteroate synthase [candidate division LCP-89 bacterium B3_LCP]|uniref:Dihydropteroate synthase n=1 Tax=candidate division LCP-89 bacterium B3_LCP TaxID=2012998 RepID=A0A532UYL7_UNCL8|nr:MAG: dihydropteroate synthase [candidate division LCP-89 bacterium B3_LCP]
MSGGKVFKVGERTYSRTEQPYVMGILNVTPDSFSDGGKYFSVDEALEQAHFMVDEGADFIDVGGESSRPGAEPVSLAEEMHRVIPVIEKLSGSISVPISVDTTKAEVAREALSTGATIVNDVSAMREDPKMPSVVASSGATVILMHMLGTPRSMQDNPYYDDLISEVHSFLSDRLSVALDAGIAADRILIDPGIGFGKRLQDNFEILGRLGEFSDLAPVLIGPSRKSFIGNTLNLPVEERQYGTAAAVSVVTLNGADVIRVHDVKEMVQVIKITSRCMTTADRGETVST